MHCCYFGLCFFGQTAAAAAAQWPLLQLAVLVSVVVVGIFVIFVGFVGGGAPTPLATLTKTLAETSLASDRSQGIAKRSKNLVNIYLILNKLWLAIIKFEFEFKFKFLET